MSKGSRREREAVELYQQAGYATYRPATVQYGENDVFGLYDILAIRPEGPFRMCQVKSNRATGIRSWCRHTSLWRSHGVVTEYLVPVDSQGWRLIRATDDGHETVVDEREADCAMGELVVQELSEGDDG